MPQKMSQLQFLKILRDREPALKDVSDEDLVSAVVLSRPDIKDKVELLRGVNKDIQDRASQEEADTKNTLVSRDVWRRHPELANWSRSVLDAGLPAAGVGIGGAIAGSGTGGVGVPWGMALGGGIGTGVNDYIQQLAGLKNTSTLGKAAHITGDTILGRMVPGMIDRVMSPAQTVREAVGTLNNAPGMFIPKKYAFLKPFLRSDALEAFAEGGSKVPVSKFGIPGLSQTRPSWQQPDFIEPNPEPNALSRIFGEKIPQGEGINPETPQVGGPQLPFDKIENPTAQGLPLDETLAGVGRPFKQVPANINRVPLQDPSPYNIAQLEAQGFKGVGKPVEGEPYIMTRGGSVEGSGLPSSSGGEPTQQSIPELQQRLKEIIPPEAPPERVKLEGLSRQQIKDFKRQGYTFKADEAGRGWLEPPSGASEGGGGSRFGLGRILQDEQGAIGDIENDPLRRAPGINPNSQHPDWRKAWSDLREGLGRDPSAAEIEELLSKQAGESLPTQPEPSPPSMDIPNDSSGQGSLFPDEMHAHNQLENISNAQNPPFELTPSPPGPEGVQHELNLEVDPKSEDPNQMRFKYRPMTGFRMADLDIFGQNLKEHNYLGSLGHGYASGELSRIPQGDPGLSVIDRSYPGQRQYDVNYRNPSGRAIAHAEAYGPEGSPLKVGTLAADKDAGTLYGKSAFEVIKKLKDLGADGPSGLYSQHTRNLFDSLKRFTDDYPDEWDQAERAIRNAAKNARKLASGSTKRPDKTTNVWQAPEMGGNPIGGATSKMAPSEPPPTVDWEPAPEDINPTADDIAESNRIRDSLLNPPSISPGSSISERLRTLLNNRRPPTTLWEPEEY